MFKTLKMRQSLILFQTYRYKPLFFRPGFTLIASVIHPKSRGRITLNSRYVEDPPVIEPNYFSHPEDVKTLIAGIRLAIRMGVSAPYKVTRTKWKVRKTPILMPQFCLGAPQSAL